MQKRAPSIRITRLYGFQPPSVVFASKTATFGSELQVSMGPRLHLSFCEYKTAWLASDLLVSMGPIPHRCCLLLNKGFCSRITSFYWSQASPVVLCMQNSVINTRPTSVFGFQPSSVVLCIQNSDFRTNITYVCGSQNSSVVLSTHNGAHSTRISSLYGFQPSPLVWCMKNSDFRTGITSLCRSQTSLEDLACKPATLGPDLQVCMCPRPNVWYWAHKTACLE